MNAISSRIRLNKSESSSMSSVSVFRLPKQGVRRLPKCEVCGQQAATAEVEGLQLCAPCGKIWTGQNIPAVHSVSRPAPSVSRPNRYDKPGPALFTPWFFIFIAVFFLFVMYLVLVVA